MQSADEEASIAVATAACRGARFGMRWRAGKDGDFRQTISEAMVQAGAARHREIVWRPPHSLTDRTEE
ncbi:MAG: hypothetical protein H5T86_03860 [Armatimonadetes bacterium]|nr:hypothetical protein [Armatimonadota bacterium]